MLYYVFLVFVHVYEIAPQNMVHRSAQSFLTIKTSVELLQVKWIGLCFEALLIMVLYFLLKAIFGESVSSTSVYLCQNQDFFLDYNFSKF